MKIGESMGLSGNLIVLPAEDRAVTQPSDLARLRQAVFGGADRSSWSIEQVIALAQAHRQDSQLMDAKQDAEDRAVTARQAWLVAIKRETDPWEVLTFDRYDQAAMFWDRAQTQWSDVYFCRVAYGPRDVCGDLERPKGAVTAPQEPEQNGKCPQPTDVLVTRLRRVAKWLESEVDPDDADPDDEAKAAMRARANTCWQCAARLDALTHAIEALRGEMENWKTSGMGGQTAMAIDRWAAILKEWEGRHA